MSYSYLCRCFCLCFQCLTSNRTSELHPSFATISLVASCSLFRSLHLTLAVPHLPTSLLSYRPTPVLSLRSLFPVFTPNINCTTLNRTTDPWSSGGITHNISDSVQAVILEHGAHHLDLFFSDPRDPPDVTFARQFHVAHMKKWVAE